ncbi:MAG: membrane protein insertase YidC [Muribaculaceae bacterium]|nr:membrane protein insertase YidC [Muribaculaceae bacterium]
MDKNTLTGLLLMGVIIFGFMWLNKPSEEEMQARKQQIEAQTEAVTSTLADKLSFDTLSQSEKAQFTNIVKMYGTANADGSVSYNNGDVKAVVADGALTGSVVVADTVVNLSEVLSGKATGAIASKAVEALRYTINNVGKYRDFAQYLSGEEKIVNLENEVLSLSLSSKGGMICSAKLKDYTQYNAPDVPLFSADTDSYSFILNSTDARYSTSEFFFTPVVENDSTVLMAMSLNSGAKFGIRYTLPANSYMVKMEIVQQNMSRVIPANIADMGFTWTQKLARHEKGRMFEERNSGIYYKYSKENVDNLSESSNDTERIDDRLKWIAFKNQFFSSVIIPDTYFLDANLESTVIEKGKPGSDAYLKNFSATADLDYSSEQAVPASFHFFFGPNKYPLLSSYDHIISPDEDLKLTRLIPLGWSFFRYINTWIVIPIFDFLGKYISNYGIIILILTIIIKIILFPFTYKSLISQAKMRLLAPDIKAINEKYPGQENAMTRSQKTMELYSRAGASPFSGCLPILLQMPILFAMFAFFPSCIELRGESFLWVKDLSAPDAIVSWTAQIPFITNYFGNHISLFCLLMTVTNIIYTRLTMQNQASSEGMPGMKMMYYLMPLMFLVFFNNYAAGLSYYYFVSLLITIIQTYVFRHFVSEEKLRQVMAQNAKKPKKKSGFMARLEEAQRQQQAALREQQKKANNSKGRR